MKAKKKRHKKKPTHVTLQMLAEKVGLTKGTCSAVLNKSAASRSVPPHTQERILAAARELKYKPSFYARNLRTKRTYMIGLVTEEIGDAYGTPVIGGIDLEPVAWHWTWERHGAPQVNSRFERKSGGRHMEGPDWAAWMAVRMIVQSSLRTQSADFAKQRAFILGDGSFDGDKGLAVSVRPWDHQVRRAVLLAAPYEILADAPVEGFLHRTNSLDTLGDNEQESPCHLNR